MKKPANKTGFSFFVETAGVEPASAIASPKTSTYLVHHFNFPFYASDVQDAKNGSPLKFTGSLQAMKPAIPLLATLLSTAMGSSRRNGLTYLGSQCVVIICT